MKRVRIAELRGRLSRYLDHVRAGGTVIVLDRDRPIAEIRPIPPLPPGMSKGDAERIERLERKGLVRRGTGTLPPGFLDRLRKRGRVSRGAPLYKAILDEREESR